MQRLDTLLDVPREPRVVIELEPLIATQRVGRPGRRRPGGHSAVKRGTVRGVRSGADCLVHRGMRMNGTDDVLDRALGTEGGCGSGEKRGRAQGDHVVAENLV